MANNRNSAGDIVLPAETIAEAHDGLTLALDALSTTRIHRDNIREATSHLRFALRKISTVQKGLPA